MLNSFLSTFFFLPHQLSLPLLHLLLHMLRVYFFFSFCHFLLLKSTFSQFTSCKESMITVNYSQWSSGVNEEKNKCCFIQCLHLLILNLNRSIHFDCYIIAHFFQRVHTIQTFKQITLHIAESFQKIINKNKKFLWGRSG